VAGMGDDGHCFGDDFAGVSPQLPARLAIFSYVQSFLQLEAQPV
jgi:hypothetical protein